MRVERYARPVIAIAQSVCAYLCVAESTVIRPTPELRRKLPFTVSSPVCTCDITTWSPRLVLDCDSDATVSRKQGSKRVINPINGRLLGRVVLSPSHARHWKWCSLLHGPSHCACDNVLLYSTPNLLTTGIAVRIVKAAKRPLNPLIQSSLRRDGISDIQVHVVSHLSTSGWPPSRTINHGRKKSSLP